MGLPCVFSDEVTPETGVSEDTVFIPLSAPVDTWVDRIKRFKRKSDKRFDNENMLRNAGYDIGSEAKRLVNYYMSNLQK